MPVCRRLALLERLADEAKAELRLGLLAPSLARQLTRLPVGNQAAVLAAVRREALTAQETRGVIDLLHGANAAQEQFLLRSHVRRCCKPKACRVRSVICV